MNSNLDVNLVREDQFELTYDTTFNEVKLERNRIIESISNKRKLKEKRIRIKEHNIDIKCNWYILKINTFLLLREIGIRIDRKWQDW